MRHQPISGAMFYMCLAVFFFSSMDADIKYLSEMFTNMQLLMSRAVFALLPVAIMIGVYYWQAGFFCWQDLKPQNWFHHALIHLSNALSLWAFYQAFGEMALADAYAVFFTAPLLVTLLSSIFLKEKIGRHRWVAVVVGFIGVLIMVRPGSSLFSEAALICGIGTFLYAVSIVATRVASHTETTLSLMITSTVTIGCVAALGCLITWIFPLGPLSPEWYENSQQQGFGVIRPIILFIGVGLVGGFGQWVSFLAFQRAEASLLTPFEFSAMIWGVMYGFLIWDEWPSWYVVGGASLIIGAGIYTVYREHKRAIVTEKIMPSHP